MKLRTLILAVIISISIVLPAFAQVQMCRYQKLYVPFYSHIYYGDQGRTLNLAVTLSVRNLSKTTEITIEQVKYYDEHGKLFKNMQEKPVKLGPLASLTYVVKESEIDGGLSPSFVVNWKADEEVSAPLVQAVQIGAQSTQGISIVTEAVVLEQK